MELSMLAWMTRYGHCCCVGCRWRCCHSRCCCSCHYHGWFLFFYEMSVAGVADIALAMDVPVRVAPTVTPRCSIESNCSVMYGSAAEPFGEDGGNGVGVYFETLFRLCVVCGLDVGWMTFGGELDGSNTNAHFMYRRWWVHNSGIVDGQKRRNAFCRLFDAVSVWNYMAHTSNLVL